LHPAYRSRIADHAGVTQGRKDVGEGRARGGDAMEQQQRDLAYYLDLVRQAPSYQDLVFLRNRIFEAAEASLPADEVVTLKRAWTERAKDETVPVVPVGQKKQAV
jgi:hypothetical protein